MRKKVRGPDSMKCIHMISRDRDHSKSGGGGQVLLEPFRKFIWFGTAILPQLSQEWAS